MQPITSPAIRYHGAKFRIAPWIISHFPEHTCYVEPFGGAAGVLLQKPRAYAEVYNDLDGDVVNFFKVLRDPDTRARLIEAVTLTPYSRADFELAWEPTNDPVERARRLAIRAQCGFGSAGASKGATGFRIDTRREYGTAQQLWAYYPEAIARAGQRMQGVLIENRPAIEVMQAHDGKETLLLIDPPYRHALRVNGNSTYRFEMTDEQHVHLLESCKQLEGMAIICGYHSEMYDDLLSGWRRVEKKARISAGRGTKVKIEVMWLNQHASDKLRLKDQRLFH